MAMSFSGCKPSQTKDLSQNGQMPGRMRANGVPCDQDGPTRMADMAGVPLRGARGVGRI